MGDDELLLEQVTDLHKRVRTAIRKSDSGLTQSLMVEYAKLLGNASSASLSNDRLSREILLLQSEVAIVPRESKDDPLIQLKWLDNSMSKLKTIVQRLYPVDSQLELRLHHKVTAAAGKLLEDGYYSQAVFEAFKSLEEYVKEKSGVKNKSGKKLMGYVFDESTPVLKIKCSRPDTAKEEQEGFKFIFMGSMLGIRNPKAHYAIVQRDRARTLQYLAFASLLFKTVDDTTLDQ